MFHKGTTTSTITQVVQQQATAMDYGPNYNYNNYDNYNYGDDYRNEPVNRNYNYDYGSLNDYNGDYSSLDEQMQQ